MSSHSVVVILEDRDMTLDAGDDVRKVLSKKGLGADSPSIEEESDFDDDCVEEWRQL